MDNVLLYSFVEAGVEECAPLLLLIVGLPDGKLR